MFEQRDVAGHQGRRHETEDLPEGEVPRHDGQDDAERIPAHVTVVAVGGDGLFGEDAGGVFGVVAASVRTLPYLRTGRLDGLADLLGEQRGELFHLMVEDAGQLAHAQRAMFERDFGIGAEGRVGDGDLRFDGVGAEGLEAAQKLAGCGIDGLNGHLVLGTLVAFADYSFYAV